MGCGQASSTREIQSYELQRSTLIKKGRYFFSNNLTKKGDINKYYKIKEEYLGKGSSGIVCEATNSKGQIFAVKRVNKNTIKSYINMTEEVEISKIVNNKNIIKTYEIFEDDKTISFVMELIEGGDLFEFILKSPNNKLSDEQTIDFLIQILETISYLHNDLNVCHRDLKPENFLIETNSNMKPHIKLIDFGFACHIPKSGYMEQYFGTPIYTAPEIIQNWSYSEKIDLWSIGVILFNMTTGCQPFSTDEDDINKEVLEKDIQFEAIDNKNIRNLCMKLLEKYPAARITAKKALEEAIEIRDNL